MTISIFKEMFRTADRRYHGNRQSYKLFAFPVVLLAESPFSFPLKFVHKYITA